jgi:hypothetical protein
MRRPLIPSDMTALILCLLLTGGARGQVAENNGTVVATSLSAACGPELQQFSQAFSPDRVDLFSALPGVRAISRRLATYSWRKLARAVLPSQNAVSNASSLPTPIRR